MTPGPLRRIAGGVGLVALLPTGWLLASGSLTVDDAAARAAVTLGAVVVVGRLAGWALSFLAGELDRAAPSQGPAERPPGPAGAAQD